MDIDEDKSLSNLGEGLPTQFNTEPRNTESRNTGTRNTEPCNTEPHNEEPTIQDPINMLSLLDCKIQNPVIQDLTM